MTHEGDLEEAPYFLFNFLLRQVGALVCVQVLEVLNFRPEDGLHKGLDVVLGEVIDAVVPVVEFLLLLEPLPLWCDLAWVEPSVVPKEDIESVVMGSKRHAFTSAMVDP